MMMEEVRIGRQIDQLRKRREQLVMTLQHIGREQEQVEQNTDWLDQAAYQSRVNLLDRLNEWYINEMHQIDEALLRIRKISMGAAGMPSSDGHRAPGERSSGILRFLPGSPRRSGRTLTCP
jgi:hypothetical protein